MTDVRNAPVLDRVSWGLRAGLRTGVALAVLASLLLMFGMGRNAKNIPLSWLWAWYAGGGSIVGLLVGVLAPIARARLGACLVGFLAAIPALAWLNRFLDYPTPGPALPWVWVLVLSAVMGGAFGWRMWDPMGDGGTGKHALRAGHHDRPDSSR